MIKSVTGKQMIHQVESYGLRRVPEQLVNERLKIFPSKVFEHEAVYNDGVEIVFINGKEFMKTIKSVEKKVSYKLFSDDKIL